MSFSPMAWMYSTVHMANEPFFSCSSCKHLLPLIWWQTKMANNSIIIGNGGGFKVSYGVCFHAWLQRTHQSEVAHYSGHSFCGWIYLICKQNHTFLNILQNRITSGEYEVLRLCVVGTRKNKKRWPHRALISILAHAHLNLISPFHFVSPGISFFVSFTDWTDYVVGS